ncbi:MAG TPA: Ku protein [Bryobacteraceae bacterium]
MNSPDSSAKVKSVKATRPPGYQTRVSVPRGLKRIWADAKSSLRVPARRSAERFSIACVFFAPRPRMHWFAEPLSALPMAIPPSKGRAARLHQDIHPMPGAYWKGYLRLSLVTCPIELFPATSQAEKTHFHQINTSNGHRLRQQMVDEETGRVVEGEHKGRGYSTPRSIEPGWLWHRPATSPRSRSDPSPI